MMLPIVMSLIAVPAAAQATADQARLSLGIGVGYVSGNDVWSVPNQPVFDGATMIDSLAISRETRSTIGVIFQGTYFPGEHLGFTGEAMLVGLGYDTNCRLAFASGSSRNASVCADIDESTDPGTAVALSAGVMYRVMSRQFVSPYLRANVGIAISQSKSLLAEGQFATSQGPATVIVYPNDEPKRITPAFGFGAGATFAAGRGYQIRLEVRDNIVGIQSVTGITENDGIEPPNEIRYTHNFSLTIGFDIVLERRRGRRY
ncbi:MAG: outer membrane beta-barrel protein [Gemmatimonadales bacterium]